MGCPVLRGHALIGACLVVLVVATWHGPWWAVPPLIVALVMMTEERLAHVAHHYECAHRLDHEGPIEECSAMPCQLLAEVRRARRAEAERADETGHLHRCARINGVWSCHPGCAVAERDAALAEAKKLAEPASNETQVTKAAKGKR